MSSKARIKKIIYDLLREDTEFRYAVAGYLGILDVLKRIDENTKAIKDLQSQVKDLQAQVKDLQSQVRDLQAQVKVLQAQVYDLQAQVRDLQSQVKELQSQVRDLQKQVRDLQLQMRELQLQVKKLYEVVDRHGRAIEDLSREIRRLGISIQGIGVRYGVGTEEAFRESIKYLIEDLLGVYRVSKWRYYDSEGIVYGHPSTIDVDVLIRDREHIIVEYKAYADKSDLAELLRIGVLYEKVTGIKPKLLMVAAGYRKRAKEFAKKLGIEIRGVDIEGSAKAD